MFYRSVQAPEWPLQFIFSKLLILQNSISQIKAYIALGLKQCPKNKPGR